MISKHKDFPAFSQYIFTEFDYTSDIVHLISSSFTFAQA